MNNRKLPLRTGVGIVVLNSKNKGFSAGYNQGIFMSNLHFE